jgi:hypothetical protein
VLHHTSLTLLVLFLFSISARRSLASDVGTGLVLHYSSKRGAGVDICVACFVKSIVHYPFLTNDIFRRARSPVCCRCSVLPSSRRKWLILSRQKNCSSQFSALVHEGSGLAFGLRLLTFIRVLPSQSTTEPHVCIRTYMRGGCWGWSSIAAFRARSRRT